MELCFGEHTRPVTQALHRVHAKFSAECDGTPSLVTTPFYVEKTKSASNLTPAELSFLGAKPRMSFVDASDALANLNCGAPFGSRLEYLKLITAITVGFEADLCRKFKEKTLRSTLMAAMKPEAFEYLLNSSKFRARHSLKTTDLGVGASGNQAAHAELKSWGRNVFQQSAERAKAVIQCFVLGEIVSHISTRLHSDVNQLQQTTILQWVAAR